MRIGAWRAAAALLALALPAPGIAHAAPWPNDPEFGGPSTPWVKAVRWSPPPPDVGWPAIAVVDTGLSVNLNDFQGYLDDQSADCMHGAARPITDASQVNDTDGHGTRVATIAAAPANGRGTVGVSPDSQLIVVKFSDGLKFNPVCAFNYLTAIANSGQLLVVNVSSVMDPTPQAEAALQRLIKAGALVVAASGNSNASTVGWPASAPHVLAVGRSDGSAATSAPGTKLDLVAPGGGMPLFDVRDGQWHVGDQFGTSFAAPIVAGIAARVWGTYADVTDPQVIAYLLRKTARKVMGTASFTTRRGFGLLDLTAATRIPLSKVPLSDETEPDDKPAIATKSVQCRTACRLHGLVASTDDTRDYWRLARRRCPRGKIRALNHAKVDPGCFVYRGRAMIVVKARKNSFAAYTLVVPRR